jgi:hypothetical protein
MYQRRQRQRRRRRRRLFRSKLQRAWLQMPTRRKQHATRSPSSAAVLARKVDPSILPADIDIIAEHDICVCRRQAGIWQAAGEEGNGPCGWVN